MSWSWSYCCWIYNYLCNQCLSPLKLWVGISLRRGVLDTAICDKICQWLGAGWWFSPGTLVSSTNKSGHHDTAEILLKVALNSMTLETNTTISILCIYPKEVWHAHKFPFQIRIFSFLIFVYYHRTCLLWHIIWKNLPMQRIFETMRVLRLYLPDYI
jgi:hypothetical protein